MRSTVSDAVIGDLTTSSIDGLFKVPHSSQPIRMAYSQARYARGTKQTEYGEDMWVLTPSRSNTRGTEVIGLAYQYPALQDPGEINPQKWLMERLGLRAVRYSLVLEYLYYIRGNKTHGCVDIYRTHFLEVLGLTDRTENWRAACEVIAAMSVLRVYHRYTCYIEVPVRGKRQVRLVAQTSYSCDPYIRLKPFTLQRELTANEAIRAINQRDYHLFDGMTVQFAHPQEFKRNYYWLPVDALKMGTGSHHQQQEIQALTLGETIIRRMATDWSKYGGILKTQVMPTFKRGHNGDFAFLTIQGIAHQAGLSISPTHAGRMRESLPVLLHMCQKNGLAGLVDYVPRGKGELTVTAPLWLWDLMQEGRRCYRGNEPEYVEILRRCRHEE